MLVVGVRGRAWVVRADKVTSCGRRLCADMAAGGRGGAGVRVGVGFGVDVAGGVGAAVEESHVDV